MDAFHRANVNSLNVCADFQEHSRGGGGGGGSSSFDVGGNGCHAESLSVTSPPRPPTPLIRDSAGFCYTRDTQAGKMETFFNFCVLKYIFFRGKLSISIRNIPQPSLRSSVQLNSPHRRRRCKMRQVHVVRVMLTIQRVSRAN